MASINDNRRAHRGGRTDRRSLFIVAGGVVAAGVLALAIWQLGGEEVESERRRTVDLDRIVIPAVPTSEELDDPATTIERDVLSGLREGASVQVAGSDGSLAQEYGAARIDPLPDAWVRMRRPWARLYGGDGRLVELEALDGTMRVPEQAIESGRLEGEVAIRIFEPGVDPEEGVPSVVIDAEDAEYDSVIGEIRSRKRVRLESADAVFVGEDLRIVLSRDGARIERLTVARALEPIRILSGAGLGSTDPKPAATPAIGAAEDRPSRASSPVSPVADGRRADSGKKVSSVDDDPATAGVDPESVYRLILADDVRIERVRELAGGGIDRSVVRGDRLVAVFTLGSTDGEGLARVSTALDSSPDPSPAPLANPTPLASVIAANATTSVGPVRFEAVEDEAEVLVHYSGRLVMTPAPDAASLLGEDGDSFLVVEGVDGRGIEFEDARNEANGTAERLEYRAANDRVEILGGETHPFRIDSPRFQLDGGRFWFERLDSRGGLVGPGRMVLADVESSGLRAAMAGTRIGSDLMIRRMLASNAGGSGAALASAIASAIRQEDDDEAAPRLEIVWEGGVDLDFVDGSDARLEQARFSGDVLVASDDFKLGSDSLVVDFDPEGATDAIKRILALGGAKVDRVGESGSLEAKTIDLGLEQTEDGRTIPTEMIAEGGVAASDEAQTLWTERLVVTFRESDGEGSDGDRGLAGGLVDGEAAMGDVEVHRLSADEAVQVRLDEGARVFADRLKGDAAAGLLELLGEDVMVVRGNVIADRMREVRLDDAKRTVRSPGPGRFRYYDEPVVEPSIERIERPDPTTRTSLEATWREAMSYRQADDGTRGRLDLEGDVRVRSTPDARTSDRLDARQVVLDLKHAAGGVQTEERRRDGGELLAREGETSLERMIARGDAVLESRTWDNDRKTGDPRLFRVTGDRVEYRVETGEAAVDGAGGLLVHDPRPPGDRAEVDGPATGFGVDGTSRFRWEKRMTMNREIGGRYLVVMEQGVEVLHAGLAEEDTMSLTGDRLEVTLDRPEADAPGAVAKVETGIELGGPAEIVRVRGIGGVFVRTPDHDVECEEFDYNVDTGIAMLRAAPGRVVTVQSKAATTPIRAERVQWDLKSGRLRILGGEGGIVR